MSTSPRCCKPMVLISRIGIGKRHTVGLPIHVYPFYENALRAHRGQSLAENSNESAELYASFAEVAERNPVSWSYDQPAASAKEIGTVSKKNRMICSPCERLCSVKLIASLTRA